MMFLVVLRRSGPEYDHSKPLEEQSGWLDHAAFMDGLVDDGFIVLGGPLADGERVLMAIDAADEREIEARFDADPWRPMELFVTAKVEPWEILLDGRV